jgi:hypothetical protein
MMRTAPEGQTRLHKFNWQECITRCDQVSPSRCDHDCNNLSDLHSLVVLIRNALVFLIRTALLDDMTALVNMIRTAQVELRELHCVGERNIIESLTGHN